MEIDRKRIDKTAEMVLSKADHYTSFGGRMNHVVHRFVRYSMIGIPSFFIDFLVLLILTENGLFYLYSVMISFIIGHSFNYTLNKVWTFRDTRRGFFQGYYRFLLLGLISLGLTEMFMYGFTTGLDVYYLYSRVITAIIVSIFNFIMNYFFTFEIHKNKKR